jgi:ribose transport system substrate-binding protein
VKVKVFSLIALAMMVTSCTTVDSGQGAQNESGGAESGIAVSLYTREIVYYQRMADGIQAAADERGIDVSFSYANSDPATQYDQLENAILKQPAGILVAPIDSEAMVPVLTSANEKGIPVVTTGNNLVEEAQDIQRAFVGHDHSKTGEMKGQYLAEKLNGTGKIGMIHAVRGLYFTDAQTQAAKKVFEKYPGITVVDEQYAGSFSTDDALVATQNMLSRFPDLDALYFDADDLAIGGVQAVQEAGRTGSIAIIGTDGTEPGVDAVRAGSMASTVLLCSYAEGYRALNVLADIVESKGDSTPTFVETPSHLVTTENIDATMEGFGPNDC